VADIDDDDFDLRYPPQPMATAPLDREVVGILVDGTEVFMCRWRDHWVRSMGGGEIGEIVQPVNWRDC